MINKMFCMLVAVILAVSILLSGCSRAYGDTDEYRNFIKTGKPESVNKTETSGGNSYVLENGTLSFLNQSGDEIWRSNEFWFVTDFKLFDVDGDGNIDCLFSLWKSYSFYEGADNNDDPNVRNHLFLYTIQGEYPKSLWGSSNLPRPIHSFEISEGIKTPVYSGTVLNTIEGEYTKDFSESEGKEYSYTWQGWGFVPEDEPQKDVQEDTSTVKISIVGDLMVHSRQLYEAYNNSDESYDFSYSFQSIREHISSADYAIGNLETVLAGKEARYSDFPAFNTPDSFATAIRDAGFDMLTTANNHSNDRGAPGIVRTIDVLDNIGLDHIGTYKSKEERNSIFIKEIKGIRIAFISYTYATNGSPLSQNESYLVNVLDESLVRKDIENAKSGNPDIIVVMPHMGDEYESQPSAEWEKWAHFMLSCGADIVVASHPHVVQPAQFVEIEDDGEESRRGFIAYSTGNFISSQRDFPTDAGMILNLYIEIGKDGKPFLSEASYVPTWVKFADKNGRFDIKVLPVWDTLNAHEKGEDVDLDDDDITRLRQILSEQSQMLLGRDPAWSEHGEYFISK